MFDSGFDEQPENKTTKTGKWYVIAALVVIYLVAHFIFGVK